METWFKNNLYLRSLKNSNPNWSIPGTDEWQALVNKCVSSIKTRCEEAADYGLFQATFSFCDVYAKHLKSDHFYKFYNALLAEKLFEDTKRDFKIDTGLEITSSKFNKTYSVSWEDKSTEAD